MRTVYWLSVAIVAYVYVGYPLLLGAWAALRRRVRPQAPFTAAGASRAAADASPARTPSISIILAARNEGARLRGRLDNLLSLDYPAAQRQVIVVSDGSRDDTAAILAGYRNTVSAILLPAAGGKAAALNAGVQAATGELLVFADARQRFAPDALKELVRPFADPRVGGVSGELLIDADAAESGSPASSASPVGEGVGLYWQYEKWLRQRESEVGSTLGATGAIYALRRALWRPLPADTLLDDVLAPMRAVLAGYRVVFAPAARAYDWSSPDASTELRRKVRTLAGNYQLLRIEPRLALPVANPVWLQFVSHKLGRLVVPYALAALLVSNAVLASSSLLYGVTLTLQVAFYVLAAHGATVALAESAGLPAAAAASVRANAPLARAAFDDPHPDGRKKGADECAA